MPRRPSSYAYEPKWDGFRAMLRTEHGLRVLSRRRWNMTPLLPELEAFPVNGVFDGELIAFSEGQPDFVALCDRMLLRSDVRIPIAFVAFDVLSVGGTSTIREPYWKRRQILEGLNLVGSHTDGERPETRTPRLQGFVTIGRIAPKSRRLRPAQPFRGVRGSLRSVFPRDDWTRAATSSG